MQRSIVKKQARMRKRMQKHDNVSYFKKDVFVHTFFKSLQPVEQKLCKKWLQQPSAFGLKYESSFVLLHKFDTDFITDGPLHRKVRYHITFMHTPAEKRRRGHMRRLLSYCMTHFDALSAFPFSEESRKLFSSLDWTFIESNNALPFVLFNK